MSIVLHYGMGSFNNLTEFNLELLMKDGLTNTLLKACLKSYTEPMEHNENSSKKEVCS